MLKRHGRTYLKRLLILITGFTLLPSVRVAGIESGNLTLVLPAERHFIARQVRNNNRSARFYQVTLYPVRRPAEHEQRLPAADGQLLFAPKTMILQPGESDNFKFYYRGPADAKERYYRISIEEIATRDLSVPYRAGSQISMQPAVILDTLFVVRPRKIHFSYLWQPDNGRLINNGNTYFKLIIRPRCQSNGQQEVAWYLLPGEQLQNKQLAGAASSYLIYDQRFITLNQHCH